MSASGLPEAAPSTAIKDPGGLPPVEEATKTPPKPPKPPAKVSHSITERRYRENLNSKIFQLDKTLSSTRHVKEDAQKPDGQDKQSVEAPAKARKADVLNAAMRYIKQAEHDGDARNNEIEFLRLRVAALEKLVNCGSCVLLEEFFAQQMTNPSNHF